MSNKPFSKIRVLDLTRVLAGPWATQLLADHGAEVIKIERPGSGDDARAYGPTFVSGADGKEDHSFSTFFACANRNKKSVTLDIAQPAAQELIRKMIPSCDVLVENFKVDDLKRRGLDYESLRVLNPRLVYCSITGFGQTGPYRHRPGYDAIFQSMSGFADATGGPDDAPGGGPIKTGVSIADVIAGINAYGAIVTALYHRDQESGLGQHIDVSLLDVMVASMATHLSAYISTGRMLARRRNGGAGGSPSQMFRCADGHIYMTVGNNDQFQRMCKALEQPDIAQDPRFSNNAGRVQHRDVLEPHLQSLMIKMPKQDVVARLTAAGVPVSTVNNMQEALADPHVQARELIADVVHPSMGPMKVAKNPVRYSGTPVTGYRAPPRLGEHTEAVLRALCGLDDAQIASLSEQRVI